MAYFYALYLCFKVFKNFNLKIFEYEINKIRYNSKFINLLKTISKINNKNEYISFLIWNSFYISDTTCQNIFEKTYLKYFKVKLNKTYRYALRNILLNAKVRNILKLYIVSNYNLSDNDTVLLKLINQILFELNIQILNRDKIQLLILTKEIIKFNQLNSYFKIIIIKQNYYDLQNLTMLLNQLFPKIKFCSYSSYKINLNYFKYKKYDLILSDNLLEGIMCYKIFNTVSEIPKLIDEFLISNFTSLLI